MAQARATLGSILNVIGSSAGTVVSILDNINAGAEMLSAHIEKMRVEQGISIKLDSQLTKTRLIDEFSQQQVTQDLATTKFCSKSAFHAERYQAAHATFSALLES